MTRWGINVVVIAIFLPSLHGILLAQSLAASSSRSFAPIAWTRTEPIEEITPTSLARIAAMRQQYQQAAVAGNAATGMSAQWPDQRIP